MRRPSSPTSNIYCHQSVYMCAHTMENYMLGPKMFGVTHILSLDCLHMCTYNGRRNAGVQQSEVTHIVSHVCVHMRTIMEHFMHEFSSMTPHTYCLYCVYICTYNGTRHAGVQQSGFTFILWSTGGRLMMTSATCNPHVTPSPRPLQSVSASSNSVINSY